MVHTPMSEILKKNPDRRTALIGGGGNTDVCPWRQTPSRRHCSASFHNCHMGYCNALLAAGANIRMKRLQSVQNTAIRLAPGAQCCNRSFVVRIPIRQPVGDDEIETRFLQRDLSLAKSITVLMSTLYAFTSSWTLLIHFFCCLPTPPVPWT